MSTSRAPPNVDEPGSLPADEVTWVATANHPIWVEGSGWADAEKLEIGDVTVDAEGGRRFVSSLVDLGRVHNQSVYNLTVANAHTFVVGEADAGTLVNNASVCSIYAAKMPARPGVYTITFNNGHRYVGMSVNMRKRVNSHFTKGGKFYEQGSGRNTINQIT